MKDGAKEIEDLQSRLDDMLVALRIIYNIAVVGEEEAGKAALRAISTQAKRTLVAESKAERRALKMLGGVPPDERRGKDSR